MTMIRTHCFILFLLGLYFETELTQSCDESCSTMTCSPPYYGTCCHKKNIAQGSQHTNQSSTYQNFYSNLAVDGNTNTDFTSNTCTQTDDDDERGACWMINLESTYNISEIKLYLRNNNADRNNGLRVLVDSTECFRLNKTFSSGPTPPEDQIQHIHCNPPIPGSLVSVTINIGLLTLCEVQIFACDPGWYGEECDRQCNCRGSTDCDKTTGWCRDGCRTGKHGNGCQCDCSNGTYGMDCRETCGHCREGTVCDKTNGICHSGCVQGFKAPLCQETALTQSCDRPCSTVTCSPPYDGTCCHKRNIARGSLQTSQSSEYREFNRYFPSDLAVDGNTNADFTNFTCTQTDDPDLRDAWWMINLESTYNISEIKLYLRNNNAHRYNSLRVLVDSTTCFRLNKTFSSGVTPPEDQIQHIQCSSPIPGSLVSVTVDTGILTLCEVQIFTCDPGWYGEECDRPCNCRDSTDCDKTTGWCRDGCRPGKQGEGCQCDCSSGTYGLDCIESCGHCLEGTVCDKTNGTCHSGCAQGYRPPLCKECDEGKLGINGECLANQSCNKLDGTCGGEESSDVAAIAGGISAVIILLIIIVVVIVGLKRRHLLLKPKKSDMRRVENKKDTSFIDISADGKTIPSKSLETKEKPKETPSRKPEEPAVKTYVKSEREVILRTPSGSAHDYDDVIPAPIILPKFAHYIKEKLNGFGFDNEFKLLPYGIHDDHDEGKKPENKKRNRLLELYPYDHSRVILKPEVDGDSDYINASYINGYRNTKTYIAAQGPKPSTVDDFWRMIWQENVSHVVMVTKLMELTKTMCEQYWPDEEEMGEFGNIRVQHKCSTVRRDYTIRGFKITHAVHTSDTREVTQLHFNSWTDHDVPSAPALVSFWKQFRRLHQEQDTGPVVVHCSTGMGQTGTFIALDCLFEEAEREKKVNVFNCVNQMRKARMNMVQTVSQYRFLHEVVLEAVRSKNTLYTSREFQLKFGTGNIFTGDQKREIQREFETLNTLRRTFTEKQVSEARLPENLPKNRDQNIIPDNKSKPTLTTVVKGRTQYINAVILPSYVRRSALLATQTPLPDTIVDFWRLVHDNDIVSIICMEDYEVLYPRICGERVPVESGPFQICLDKERERGSSCTQINISLTNLEKPKATRQITVYRPSCTRPSDLLEFVNEMDTSGVFKQGQVLVHCSNGSDLCGLFCGVLNIITRLRLHQEVDIFLDIRELQSIRPSFIHSLNQYKFCFDAVKEYLRSTSIYENV